MVWCGVSCCGALRVQIGYWDRPNQKQFFSGDNSATQVCGHAGLDWTWRNRPITNPYNWDPVNGRPL